MSYAATLLHASFLSGNKEIGIGIRKDVAVP